MSTTTIQLTDALELVARYGYAYDTNDKATLAAVFTDDAEYAVSLSNGTVYAELTGRDAILGFVGGTRDGQPDQRRHVLSNVHRLPGAPAGALRVRAYLLLVSNGASLDEPFEALGTGVYELDIVDDGGELRFSRFILVLDRPF